MSIPRGILLDTSAIIDLERIDLGDFDGSPVAVSAVSVAELAYGLDVDDPVERRARTDRYYDIVAASEVLPFDLEAAKVYGVLAALLRKIGRNPRPRRMDLQIAATAAANSMPLLTRNAADFVGLQHVVDVVPI